MSSRRCHSDRGATLVEYAVLVAVLVVAVVPALAFLEGGLGSSFETQAAAMSSDSSADPTPDGGSTTTTTTTTTATATNAAPAASFSVTCADLVCTFTDGSVDADGTVVSWAWDFGDGATSSEADASRTYASPGSYSVTLTVADDVGATGTWTSTAVAAAPNEPPTAAFTSACTYLACTFTNTSTDADGTISSSSWSYGDGGSSTSANGARTFSAPGSYLVQLTVTDEDGGTGTVEQELVVTAAPQYAALQLVGSLSGSSAKTASVSVTVKDAARAGLAGVKVTGTLTYKSGPNTPRVTISCTTGVAGTCTATQAGLPASAQNATFTITEVDHPSWNPDDKPSVQL